MLPPLYQDSTPNSGLHVNYVSEIPQTVKRKVRPYCPKYRYPMSCETLWNTQNNCTVWNITIRNFERKHITLLLLKMCN